MAAPWRFFKSLVKRDNWARGPALQERADLLRLYLLTGWREAGTDAAPLANLDDVPASAEQRRVLKERVRLQALTLLEQWRVEQPPAMPPEPESGQVDDERRAELEAERAAEMAEAQQRAFGFKIHVGPSTAAGADGADAGQGVFIEGRAPPGSVVLFYPGVTFDPFDILLLRGGVRRFEGNSYLMARFDRSIVDASLEMLKLLPAESLGVPITRAHLVNHPPAGSEPNVMPAAVDWDRSVPADLLTLLPNVSYSRSAAKPALLGSGSGPGGRRTVPDLFQDALADIRPPEPPEGPTLQGLTFVTTRPVEDEELFLNYRFNPSNGYPDWYTPVDADEDARRWRR